MHQLRVRIAGALLQLHQSNLVQSQDRLRATVVRIEEQNSMHGDAGVQLKLVFLKISCEGNHKFFK